MFADPVRHFYGADVLALAVMRTSFGNQDSVAVAEVVELCYTAHRFRKVAFVARHEDRERGQRDITRNIAADAAERLRVGDDHFRRLTEFGEGLRQLRVARDNRNRTRIENIADRLLLGKNQTSLRRGLVNRRDENDEIARFEQIGDDALIVFLGFHEMSHPFAQFMDVRAVRCADENFVCGRGRDIFQKVGFVVCDQVGDFLRFKRRGQRFIHVGQPLHRVHDENGEVGLVEGLHRALDAHLTEFAFVVDAGGVNDDDRAEGEQLHCLFDGVGGRALDIGHQRECLSGHGVDDA